jgi:hypothetical protein
MGLILPEGKTRLHAFLTIALLPYCHTQSLFVYCSNDGYVNHTCSQCRHFTIRKRGRGQGSLTSLPVTYSTVLCRNLLWV